MAKNRVLAVIFLLVVLPAARVQSQQNPLGPIGLKQRSFVVEIRSLVWDGIEKSELPEPLEALFCAADPHRVEWARGLPMAFNHNSEIPVGHSAILTVDPAILTAGSAKSTCLILNLEAKEVDQLIEASKSDQRSSITSAPCVTMVAGQTAEIANIALQGFVAGIEPSHPVGTSTEFRPRTEQIFVPNGSTIVVGLGQITDGRVDVQIKESTFNVLDVFQIPVEKAYGQEPGPQIQFPDVDVRVREFAFNCELGRTFLVVLGTREVEKKRRVGIPIPGTDRHFAQKNITEKSRQLQTLLIQVREPVAAKN